MCRRVFNKTIILLGLAGYEMIITNLALHASLVIHQGDLATGRERHLGRRAQQKYPEGSGSRMPSCRDRDAI